MSLIKKLGPQKSTLAVLNECGAGAGRFAEVLIVAIMVFGFTIGLVSPAPLLPVVTVTTAPDPFIEISYALPALTDKDFNTTMLSLYWHGYSCSLTVSSGCSVPSMLH